MIPKNRWLVWYELTVWMRFRAGNSIVWWTNKVTVHIIWEQFIRCIHHIYRQQDCVVFELPETEWEWPRQKPKKLKYYEIDVCICTICLENWGENHVAQCYWYGAQYWKVYSSFVETKKKWHRRSHRIIVDLDQRQPLTIRVNGFICVSWIYFITHIERNKHSLFEDLEVKKKCIVTTW